MRQNSSSALAVGVAMACLFGVGTAAMAADYYLSPSGKDSNPGTRSQPWQSLAKVNATHLVPGDRVLLASGATFIGGLVLDATEGGTARKPIVIGASGREPAIIASPGQTAISAVGGGITIRDLILRGHADRPDKTHGIVFFTDDKSGVKYRDITIDHVEIAGFGGDGISIGSGGDAGPGYENVRITQVNVHDNDGTGIMTFDAANPTHAHKNFTLTDCVATNNHSGSGIILSGIDHAVAEFCRSSGNDGKGGGVGIWAYSARDVTFRYCIASGTTTNNGGDGGGFDLDGACVNCMVDSCLTYGNDGPGYMHCDYPWASATIRNVIRSSVSVNDGRKAKGGPFGFGFCVWGGGLDDCVIHDTLTLVTVSDPQARQNGVFWVSFIPESAQDLAADHDKQHLSGCVFRDNIAFVAGSGVGYVTNDMPKATTANVLFVGNEFRADKGLSPVLKQGETQFETVAQWRAATGQETNSAQAASSSFPALSPGLAAKLCRITDPRILPRLAVIKALRARPTPPSEQGDARLLSHT